MAGLRSRSWSSLIPFLLWLVAFYCAWMLLLLVGQRWADVVAHWPIALAMLFGSFVAGSTPMGGGTIGYPVLVMLLGNAPQLGRDFSFAIQSIGMTSASIYILCTRKPLASDMLIAACLGSALGTPLGIWFIAPHVPEWSITVLFAVVWASFGLLTLRRQNQLCAHSHLVPGYHRLDRWLGAAVGFFGGGLVAAVTGVGIDMLIFCTLVLVRRADLRMAVPTSVVLMAFTSLVGLFFKAATATLPDTVFPYWLAASPIVALGAPFGAFVASWVNRRFLLQFVSLLCLGQLVLGYWRHWSYLGYRGLLWGVIGLCAFQLVFLLMECIGRWLPAAQCGVDSQT